MNKRAAGLAAVLCLALGAPSYGEQEFALSLAPQLELPAGNERFGSGLGAAAAFDWAFLPFAGLSAGGAFASLPTEAGGAFLLVRGSAGPFFRVRPFDRWTFRADLRAGIYQYQWQDHGNARLFLGGALRAEFHLSPYLSLYSEGQYLRHFFSENPLDLVALSLGARLNLSEIMGGQARVRGEKTEQRRVFPVSYAWYKDNPVAMARITNNEPNAITDVSLSLFMERYMGQPETFAVIPRLGAGESITTPVTALFNEVMLSLTENVAANGQILVRYRSLGARKETEFPAPMPVYHRNALSWDDDRRAASFVSPRDGAARLFARHAASIADSISGEIPAAKDLPRNVRHAAALFEALGAYGMSYVVDPASAFVEMSADATALDSLNYPHQTLYYHGGDCDDLSILYCAMLEALGIDTAFITIPGHIYAAFDVGDAAWGTRALAAGNLIEQDGTLWMPVELTVPGEGFFRAWRIGARQWRVAAAGSSEEPRLYPMRDSWRVYPPVTAPGAGDNLPTPPEDGELARRFRTAAEDMGR